MSCRLPPVWFRIFVPDLRVWFISSIRRGETNQKKNNIAIGGAGGSWITRVWIIRPPTVSTQTNVLATYLKYSQQKPGDSDGLDQLHSCHLLFHQHSLWYLSDIQPGPHESHWKSPSLPSDRFVLWGRHQLTPWCLVNAWPMDTLSWVCHVFCQGIPASFCKGKTSWNVLIHNTHPEFDGIYALTFSRFDTPSRQ